MFAKRKRKGKGASGRRGRPAEPAKIGRYEILDSLGQGGMGTVFLGHDPVIGRRVAIKVISVRGDLTEEEARQYRERFLREARAAGALQHPNIVAVHDIGLDPRLERPYIVMEYVEGRDLKAVLASRAPLPPADAVRVALQIASGLDFAHRRGIVHRDIKPANVLIGERGQVKITDFGVARLPNSELTRSDQLVGSPGFVSPEQLQGEAVDGRSDLFALGVIFYQLLTGRSPFEGDSVSQVLYRISSQPFTPPSAAVAGLPEAFDPILERALSKDPASRYQTGRDFMEALLGVQMALEAAGRGSPDGAGPAPPAPGAGGGGPEEGRPAPGGPPAAREPSPWLTLTSQWRIAALLGLLVLTFLGVNWAIYVLLRGPLRDLAPGGEGDPSGAMLPGGGPALGTLAAIGGALPAHRAAPRAGPAVESARLQVRLDHHLASGRLVVVVGGRTALSRPFDAPRGAASGSLVQTLSVPAGRHEIEVELVGRTGRTRARSRITGTMTGGRVAVLRIEQSGGAGRSLRLRWVAPEGGAAASASR